MKHRLSDAMIGEVTSLFEAMGDQSRLRILRAILDSRNTLSQGAIAEATGLSQANASKHLACLVRVGLLAREQNGNTVYFTPVQPLVSNICDLVCGHVAQRAKSSYHSLR